MPTSTTIQELWGGTASRSVDGLQWTPIADVKSVTVPTIKTEIRNRTSLSTVGNSKEFGKGRTENGDFTIECFATKAGMTAAIADAGRAFTWLKLALADGTIFSAKCIVNWEVTEDIEGDSMIKLIGSVSGEVTVTVGA